MLITGLIVENFQPHKAAELKFAKGVNVIKGLSHSGKTALLRALTLVIKNRPLGDAFINWDAEDVFIAVLLEKNGVEYTVSRGKGKHGNYYKVQGGFDYDDKVPGTDVPECIKELFNMSDVNIQKQLSPYYLVCESPGKVAGTIRAAARLDEIDRTVDVLKSKIRTANTTMKAIGMNLTANKEALEKFEGVDLNTLDSNIKKIEDLLDAESALKDKVNKLANVIAKLKAVELLDVSFDGVPSIEKQIDSGKRLAKDCERIKHDILNLQTSIDKLKVYDTKLEQLDKDIRWSGIQVESCLEDLVDCPACGAELTQDTRLYLLEHSC